MVGINSFIVVTEPLGAEGDAILPGGESAADSRFVVRYWRKSPDGRLIFGGGESNAGRIPADVSAFVRPHLVEIYPQTCRRPDRAWLGRHRLGHRRRACPIVREIAPAVWAAGGYSGQGVALAPFLGKLLAEAALGRPERLGAFTEIPIPRFAACHLAPPPADLARHLAGPLLGSVVDSNCIRCVYFVFSTINPSGPQPINL